MTIIVRNAPMLVVDNVPTIQISRPICSFVWALRCLLVAASLLPVTASAGGGLYLGASGGRSAIKASANEIDTGFSVDDGFTASGTTLDKTDNGWKGYLGVRLNSVFAVEGGYADLGTASFDTTIVAAPAGIPVPLPFTIHGTAKARGAFLSAVFHLPLTEELSLFAKAGAFRSSTKFTEVIDGTGITRVSDTERRTDGNYGAGVQWMLFKQAGVRLEWERFRKIGFGIGGREGRDVDFMSAGLVVQF